MAIKSAITTAVNGFITAIITQAKVRSSLSTLLDNFYPTVVYDTDASTNIFTKADTDFSYDIKTSKVGRNVNICGSFTNDTGFAVGSQKLADITTTEYRTDALVLNHYIPAFSLDGQKLFLSLVGNSIEIIGSSPDATTFYFNGTYTTKD